MKIGRNLFEARKKMGLSQEDVAEKLGVSRQTISKWELDETLPDIFQAKKLATIYRLSLDELIEFDSELYEIYDAIENVSRETEERVDWTKAWSKRYPILATYQKEVKIEDYAIKIRALLNQLKRDYGYSSLEALLVLKDILAHVWNSK